MADKLIQMNVECSEGRAFRVVIYVPSTGSAMGHALESLLPGLADACEVLLVVPEHFKGCTDHKQVIRFRSHGNKLNAALREANLYTAFRLHNQIADWKPDVVHFFNGDGYPWTIALAYLFKRRNIRTVLSVHDGTAHPGEVIDQINSRMRILTSRYVSAAHILTPSSLEMLPESARSRPVALIPHWTTEDLFLRFRRQARPRESMILFFGRILQYKGLNTLVRATLILDGKFKTVIAGHGTIDSEVKALIATRPELFDVQNRFVSNSEIADYLQRSSICALPYTHVTQSSIPMIAAAFGVPVVASRLGGFIEDINDENGCLVPPNDPAAFAAAVMTAAWKSPKPLTDRSVSSTVTRLLSFYKDL